MVQVEEVELVPLLPGPRGVPKVEQDAFEIGTDEASRGPLGGELLGDRQLEVHLRPVVMEADRVQVPPPPPPALLLDFLPADLQGVSRAQDALEDVPHEEPVLAPHDLLVVRPTSVEELEVRRVDEPRRHERQNVRREEVKRLEVEAVVHVELVVPGGVVEIEVPHVPGPGPHMAADRQRPTEDRERAVLGGTFLVRPPCEVRSVRGSADRHDHVDAEDGEHDRAVGPAFLRSYRAHDLPPPRHARVDRVRDQARRRGEPAPRLDPGARDELLHGEADEARRVRALDQEGPDEKSPGLGTERVDLPGDAAARCILERAALLRA